jgi:hypothetical protein
MCGRDPLEINKNPLAFGAGSKISSLSTSSMTEAFLLSRMCGRIQVLEKLPGQQTRTATLVIDRHGDGLPCPK